MSFDGITDHAPEGFGDVHKLIEAQSKWKNKIVSDFVKESDLRGKNESLQNAWEQYQVVLQLVKEQE